MMMPQWIPRVVLSGVMLAAHVATAAADLGRALGEQEISP
jgi:hypothetical protein